MVTRGKKYISTKQKFEVGKDKKYGLEEALGSVKSASYAKFDETIDMAVRLGVDPRHSDQMVRGTVALPHGTGKKVRILVFAKGEKEKEASEAGADFVGGEDYIEKINQGWLDFDRVVATPDMMAIVGKLGKILGPRGLMPNPKTGTVTFNIKEAVQEIKAGKVEFRVEKAGIIHIPLGKVSFSLQNLLENSIAVLDKIIKVKPISSKGQYLKSIAVSSTMGPGLKIDVIQVQNLLR